MYRLVGLLLSMIGSFGLCSEVIKNIDQPEVWLEGYETKAQLDSEEYHPLVGLSVATIGSSVDSNCTYTAGPGVIQTAIDDGYDEIRLVFGIHLGNLEIFDKSINIKGKYDTCLSAQNDVVSLNPSHISTISGDVGAAMPVARISGDSQRNFVLFKNLHISNGEPAQSPLLSGGGIDVRQADLRLTLDTVQVINNQGTLGGGISVFGNAINVFMVDSLIVGNSAEEGGGLYCFGKGATINMRDTGPDQPSGVALNQATNGNGGGLFIWGSCDFSSTSGSYGMGGFDLNGIVGNSATGHGGGVYVSAGSEVTLDGAQVCSGGLPNVCTGNNDSNVRVSGNSADSDDDNDGSGGGVYATGSQAFVNLTNALVAENTAFNGGGMSANNSAVINMSTHYSIGILPVLDQRCWSPGSCSQIVANEARALGGGAQFVTGSFGFIDRTVIKQNRANNAAALFVMSENGSSDISVVDLLGSLVVNNGEDGLGGFEDFNAITLTGGQAFIKYTTFADNDVQGAVIGSGANGLLSIDSSIIHQLDDVPTYVAFNPNNQSSIRCLMVSTEDDFSGFAGPNLLVNDPAFVDRVAGDYHLTNNSPAIDVCLTANVGTPLRDLDDEIRGWDDPAIQNPTNFTFDLGYDENVRFSADLIFKNGFEEES